MVQFEKNSSAAALVGLRVRPTGYPSDAGSQPGSPGAADRAGIADRVRRTIWRAHRRPWRRVEVGSDLPPLRSQTFV